MTEDPVSGKQQRTLLRNGSFSAVRLHRKKRFSDIRDSYHALLSMPWWRFLIVLAATYFSINTLFGLGYFLCGPGGLVGVNQDGLFPRLLDCFFFSVQTFATIGYGRISPVNVLANLLVTMEAGAGLLSMSLATGLLFVRFSRPTARIEFANNAVVSMHDGVPSLLFRIANHRGNQITHARISATLLMTEKTLEGETFRNFYDLKLDRENTPFFSLTWTIVHEIGDQSPLKGKSREELKALNAEIMLSVSGIDDTFNSQVHARFSYIVDEILWGKRFVDILGRMPDGHISIDIDKLHDVVDA